MSSKKQRNKFRDARHNVPVSAGVADPAGQLEAAWQAAGKSDSALVQKSLESLIEAAAYVLDLVRAEQKDTPTPGELADALKDYGKCARRVDFIAVVSAAASKKYGRHNDDIKHVRSLIDGALAACLKMDDRGMISPLRPVMPDMAIATQSKLGRWLARRIAGMSGTQATPANILPLDLALQEAQRNYKAGQLETALRQYQEIVARDPKNIAALSALGVVCVELDRREDAVIYCRQALRLDSDNVALRVNLANALWEHVNITPAQKKNRGEALGYYEEILRAQPDNIQMLTNIGSAHLGSDRCDEAEQMFAKALKLDPDFPPALTGMGMIKYLELKYEEAAQLFIKAIRVDPRYVEAIANLAFIRLYQGNHKEAGVLYDRAIQTKPRATELWRFKAFYLMATDRYREGWDLYEKERALDRWHQAANPFPAKPAWDGKPDPNLRLLIWHEQGLGDSLQFIRYVALCRKYVGKVFIFCPPSLISLFKNCPYVDDAFSSGFSFKFDAQVALMSLPHLMTSVTAPPAEIPYLFISAQKKKYAERFFAAEQKRTFRVGLVWAGNPRKHELGNYRIDRRRSIHLQTMLPLFDVQGVVFYNLQKDEPAAQIDACGLRDRMVDLMPQSNSYEETGAIIEHLDLVIAVDTSLVHLAGGLGKPVWVLSRYDGCWRWLRNRRDSPWYPTARVFGQKKPGDWDAVIAEVRTELEALVSQSAPPQMEIASQKVYP